MELQLVKYKYSTCLVVSHVHVQDSKPCYFIDPPAINITEVTDKCTNDFTVSWTAASDEELFYDVVLLLGGVTVVRLMDNSHNFANLIPNTTYNVSIATRPDTCVGIFNTMMITTLAVEEGLPQSELHNYGNLCVCTFTICITTML